MSDLTTIFVKGGEYVDSEAYIQQRDEAERLREKCMNKDAEIERLRGERLAFATEAEQLKIEIERLKAELFTMRNVFHQQDAEIERLRAVVDAARHLLAGGDKEAVYHLKKAIAALEDSDE